jgi:hypothetical protein
MVMSTDARQTPRWLIDTQYITSLISKGDTFKLRVSPLPTNSETGHPDVKHWDQEFVPDWILFCFHALRKPLPTISPSANRHVLHGTKQHQQQSFVDPQGLFHVPHAPARATFWIDSSRTVHQKRSSSTRTVIGHATTEHASPLPRRGSPAAAAAAARRK